MSGLYDLLAHRLERATGGQVVPRDVVVHVSGQVLDDCVEIARVIARECSRLAADANQMWGASCPTGLVACVPYLAEILWLTALPASPVAFTTPGVSGRDSCRIGGYDVISYEDHDAPGIGINGNEVVIVLGAETDWDPYAWKRPQALGRVWLGPKQVDGRPVPDRATWAAAGGQLRSWLGRLDPEVPW